MAKRRTRKKTAEETAGQRVKWLLDNLWSGNRLQMASDVSVSHTAINNIANGTRPPGRRLLQAIATHPKVNPAWLLMGEGEPLLAKRADDVDAGWLLPISNMPLPGHPEEHKPLMSGEFYPVTGSYHKLTRYWLAIAPTDPITRDRGIKVADGDLLLMESDPNHRRHVERLDQRLAVIRVKTNAGEELKLGQISYDPATHEDAAMLRANTFDAGTRPDEAVEGYTVLFLPNQEPRITKRLYRKQDPDKVVPVSQVAIYPVLTTISKQNIVAVCILIVRRFE